MRFLPVLCVFALVLAGCQGSLCNSSNPVNPVAYGAAPAPETDIFGNECGQPVYAGLSCPDTSPFQAAEAWVNENIFQCDPEGSFDLLQSPVAQPMAAAPNPCLVPAATPVPMATTPESKHCGALPPQAKPGETWCCVKVQPAAAAPERVCVAPASQRCIPVAAVMGTESRQILVAEARLEWQKIVCENVAADSDCYKLVEIPAQYRTETYQVELTPASTRYEEIPARYEMRASAPPPAYWEWRKVECKESFR